MLPGIGSLPEVVCSLPLSFKDSLYIVDILGKDGTFSLSVMPNQLESSLSQNGSWESGRKRENDSYGGGGKSKKILPRVSFSYLKSPYPFTQHLCHMYQPID